MSNTFCTRRGGFSLIEIVLATILLTVMASALILYLRQPADRVKRETCNMQIGQLEIMARQFYADRGTWPSARMSELTDTRYLGQASIPRCPVDGRQYRLDRRTGNIQPHNHP